VPRRVVVTEGPHGPSVEISEYTAEPTGRQGGVTVAALWAGALSAAGLAARDPQYDPALSPPAEHADFRFVTFPAEDGRPSEPYWHQTDSIDFGMVLDGAIRLLLPGRSVDLAAGDVVIQCGTAHAWVNAFEGSCRMTFLLIGIDRTR
jgi:hypothetical protein